MNTHAAFLEEAAALLGVADGPQLDMEIRDLLCGTTRPAGL